MCQTLRLRPGDTMDDEIHRLSDLRAIWPDLVPDARYPAGIPAQGNLCLCPVDIPASAAANGAAVRRDETDPSIWWLAAIDNTPNCRHDAKPTNGH